MLLLDTYDTEKAGRKVVELAPVLAREGIQLFGVRLDSGDMAALSKNIRRLFDENGLKEVRIVASGGLDEYEIARLLGEKAPIDGFGVGTSLTTSGDAPNLDCVYKLQEYAGLARRKRSAGKATWPGRKQVYRRLDDDGKLAGDVITVVGDALAGVPLLHPVIRDGRRLDPRPSLADSRELAEKEYGQIPLELRGLDVDASYDVEISPRLRALAELVDRRQK